MNQQRIFFLIICFIILNPNLTLAQSNCQFCYETQAPISDVDSEWGDLSQEEIEAYLQSLDIIDDFLNQAQATENGTYTLSYRRILASAAAAPLSAIKLPTKESLSMTLELGRDTVVQPNAPRLSLNAVLDHDAIRGLNFGLGELAHDIEQSLGEKTGIRIELDPKFKAVAKIDPYKSDVIIRVRKPGNTRYQNIKIRLSDILYNNDLDTSLMANQLLPENVRPYGMGIFQRIKNVIAEPRVRAIVWLRNIFSKNPIALLAIGTGTALFFLTSENVEAADDIVEVTAEEFQDVTNRVNTARYILLDLK